MMSKQMEMFISSLLILFLLQCSCFGLHRDLSLQADGNDADSGDNLYYVEPALDWTLLNTVITDTYSDLVEVGVDMDGDLISDSEDRKKDTAEEQHTSNPVLIEQLLRDDDLQDMHYNLPLVEQFSEGNNKPLFMEFSGTSLAASQINIYVSSTQDASSFNGAYCYPATTANNPSYDQSKCNLRSAWDACYRNNIVDQICTISLPANQQLSMNTTLGALRLSEGMNVVIVGNNATVRGIANSYAELATTTTFNGTTASFPYDSSMLTNTAAATQNYAQACLSVCPGKTVQFSTCAGATIGDTYLRLFTAGGTNVINNDDFCGLASQITYTVPKTTPLTKSGACPTYCLRMGCKSSGSCKMTVNAYFLRPNATELPPQFISYITPSSGPWSPPSLTLTNFTVSSFGSLFYNGAGAINMTGNATVNLAQMIFRDNQASIGGAMAMVNNRQGSLSISRCYFIHNCAMAEGGSLYLSRSSVLSKMDRVYVINNHAFYGGFMSLNVNSSNVNISRIQTISTSVTGNGSFSYAKKFASNIAYSSFTLTDAYSGAGGSISFHYFTSNFLLEDATISGVTSLAESAGIFIAFNASNIIIRRTNWQNVIGNTAGISRISNSIQGVLVQDLWLNDCRTTSLSSNGCMYFFNNVTQLVMQRINMNRCINSFSSHGCLLVSLMSNMLIEDVRMSNSYTRVESCFIRTINVDNATFQHMVLTNGTTQSGAPISSGTNSTRILWSNVTVSNCRGISGGCMRIIRSNNATFQNIRLTNCTAKSQTAGGAIDIYSSPNLIITDMNIFNAKSQGTGGGIAIDYSVNVTMSRINIQRCSVPLSGSGGGLYIGTQCNKLTFINSSISNCRAGIGGGIAINAYSDYVSLAGNSITNNFANSKGGGIYVGQNNYELLISDLEGFQRMKIIESPHPYVGQNPINNVRQVLYSTNASFPGADEIIINFDKLSSMQSTDVVNIYTITTVSGAFNKQKILVYSGNSYFPGVDTPSLRVPGDSMFVEFLGSNGGLIIQTGLYGFRFYAYPVIRKPTFPSLIHGNIAIQRGGGLFFFYVNSFSVLINTIVESNSASAGDGGGMSMQIGNGGTAMQQVNFLNNSAYYDGGGLVLLSGQFGITIRKCNFFSNVAVTGSGGGQFLSSSNGDGILTSRNNISCALCRFQNNSAAVSGGAIFLNDDNYLSLNTSLFSGNKALQESGGALGLGGYGITYLIDCTVSNNSAAKSGGGLSAAKASTVYLTNTSFVKNTAAVTGGGISLNTNTKLFLRGKIKVDQNSAGFTGGGIALFRSPLWSTDAKYKSKLVVSGNRASRGSALSFFQLEASNNKVENTIFEGNTASQGNTVFWVYDGVMQSEPPGLSPPSSNSWTNNAVLYGGEIGTQAVYIIPPQFYNVTIYGAPVDPPIDVRLLDYYHQTMTITGVTTIYPSLVLSSEKCSQYPFLSGEDLAGSGVTMEQGVASFTGLETYCSPSGNVTLSFKAEVGSLTGFPSQYRTPYYISNKTFLSFRPCVAGEYEAKGMCQECPLYSYNLQDKPTFTCESCHSIPGVSSCQGRQIVLEQGYWRRYATNSAVMKCLLTPSSCTGGNETSDASCAEGYSGPLCAICAPTYFHSDNECLSCNGGNEMSPTAIAMVIIFSLLLLLVGVLVYFRYGLRKKVDVVDPDTGDVISTAIEPSTLDNILNWCKQKYSVLMVKIKILVSTFQVVISTAGVFSVSMPVTFTKFANSLKFLNLGFTSIFPLGCSNSFTYFDSLLWTTLIPLLICGLFIAAFFVEFTLVRRKIQANPNRQHGDKKKAFNNVNSKYLSYMFYLTYLVLPSVTTTIFQAFICTNIDPNNEDDSQYDLYLKADMSISCQSSEYYSWMPFVVLMILIYPIGIPAMYFCFLYYNREEIRDRDAIIAARLEVLQHTDSNENEKADNISTSTGKNPLHSSDADEKVTFAWQVNQSKDVETGASAEQDKKEHGIEIDEESQLTVSATRLKFLWESYKPIYWYFELVETTRRIMLTAVLSVCSPGSSSQSVLGLLLSFIYLLYYGVHQPYGEKSDFVLAGIGQIQIYLTFFSALIIQNKLLSNLWVNALGALLTISNLSIVYVTLQYEAANYREEMKLKEEEKKAIKERMIQIARAQRQKIADKLRESSFDIDNDGQDNGDSGSRRPVFQKKSTTELMTLSDAEDIVLRPSNGIELKEFRSVQRAPEFRQQKSIRLSDVMLDSDDED